MKTILFLGTKLGVGGAEQIWAELIPRLDRARFRPILCCFYEPGPLGERLKESGVLVYSHLARHRGDIQGLFRLRDLLRRERVDCLFMINQPMAQFWGTLCGKLAKTPVLVTAIHSTGKINRIQRRRWINRLTFPFVDRVTAVTETHKAYLTREEGIPFEKIEIVPNGIEARKFLTTEGADGLAKSLGIEDAEGVVGIVAMLRPEKAHEVFLKAASQVLQKNPRTHFLIVGDGPERGRLEALAERERLQTHVHFLGAREDVPQILSLLDVACLSSHSVVETLSVSVLEYMAAAKPVVATRVGSLAELVEDSRNGFLVDPGDDRALADRILLLLRDRSLAHQMGERGREKVLKEYTVEQMVGKTEALFAKLLQIEEVNAVCA